MVLSFSFPKAPRMQPFDINELKARLVRSNSKKFCGAIQRMWGCHGNHGSLTPSPFLLCPSLTTDTSRPIRPGEENAKHYHFVTRNEMRNEIQLKHFIEHSEYDGHFYSLSINTVRDVMNQGKVCLLILAPRVSIELPSTKRATSSTQTCTSISFVGTEIPSQQRDSNAICHLLQAAKQGLHDREVGSTGSCECKYT